MINEIVIAVTIIVCAIGFVVAVWSIVGTRVIKIKSKCMKLGIIEYTPRSTVPEEANSDPSVLTTVFNIIVRAYAIALTVIILIVVAGWPI